MNDDFKKRIEWARAQVADRAAYLMHKTLGLVKNEAGFTPPTNSAAALAKVVANLRARREKPGAGSGYTVVVEGLERGPARDG